MSTLYSFLKICKFLCTHKKFRQSIILSIFLLVIVPTLSFASNLIFEDDFESRDVGKSPSSKATENSRWGCSGNCTVVTTERARNGKKSMKTYLNRNTSNVRYRTEAVPRFPNNIIGIDYWYGFSIFIPNSNIPDFSGDTIAQWHAKNKAHPVTLRVIGTHLNLIIRDENKNTAKTYSLGPYDTNRWCDWVFHARWSPNSDGILEVWKDGIKVVSHKGVNMKKQPEPDAPWLKIGLYKSVWRSAANAGTRYDVNISSRVYYHDEVRIAAGKNAKFSDVDPNQSSKRADALDPPGNLMIKFDN